MIATSSALPSHGVPEGNDARPVRVHTLGRFAVVIEGRPLAFRGRAQTKPLALLRALIAFGGCGVPAARLGRALWPNKRPDTAQHARETNLCRLRKLLGGRCVEMRGGELALNTELCWVDVRELEELLERTTDGALSTAHTQRLLRLYQGPFLDGDDTAFALLRRERLHSKFLRVVGRLGRTWESLGHYPLAIECYERGIEVEPLAEQFYCRLMRCLREIERPAEASAVYRRCCRTLGAILGVQPAAETQALYREIRDDYLDQAHAGGIGRHRTKEFQRAEIAISTSHSATSREETS